MDIKTLEILENILSELTDNLGYAKFEGLVDKPTGKKQKSDIDGFDYEYCHQLCHGYAEDAYYGFLYLPIKDKYIQISYEC